MGLLTADTPLPECDVEDCESEVHSRGAITFSKCTKHYLQSMSNLREEGQFTPD